MSSIKSREKHSLSKEFLHGYTYRQIRDALKKLGSWSFLPQFFIAHLAKERVWQLMNEKDHYSSFSYFWFQNFNYLTVDRFFYFCQQRADEFDFPFDIDAGLKLLQEAEDVFSEMIGDELIRLVPDPDHETHQSGFNTQCQDNINGLYYIDEKGETLKAQKALKGISKARANSLISKMVGRAKEHNSNDRAFFQIDAIWAFGSILTDAETLGDVDVAIAYTQRFTEKYPDHFDWMAAEREYCVSIGIRPWYSPQSIKEPKKALRCSPYVSPVDAYTLNQGVAAGDMQAKLIWVNEEADICRLKKAYNDLPFDADFDR